MTDGTHVTVGQLALALTPYAQVTDLAVNTALILPACLARPTVLVRTPYSACSARPTVPARHALQCLLGTPYSAFGTPYSAYSARSTVPARHALQCLLGTPKVPARHS